MLRGAHSINATNREQGPLVIVDGILLNGNSTDINPEDIESIEVVKGAAGASIYGSRAQNGVISIKTKRATDARTGLRIEARQETGTDDIQGSYPFPTRHMMLMDETGTRYCVKNTAIPHVLAHARLGHRSDAHQRRHDANTLNSNPLERDYGLSSNPIEARAQRPVRDHPVPEVVQPDRPHQDQPAALELDGRT